MADEHELDGLMEYCLVGLRGVVGQTDGVEVFELPCTRLLAFQVLLLDIKVIFCPKPD
jgi:hypothetical protein